jgi:hypothetical protein
MDFPVRSLNGRHQSKQHPRADRGDGGRDQDPPIDRDDVDPGLIGRQQGDDGAEACIGHGDAGDATAMAKQQALGQHLPGDSASARRPAIGAPPFPASGRRAGQHQVGEVDARDQQHRRHGAEQHVEHRPGRADERFESGRTVAPLPLLVAGYSCSSCRAMLLISAVAASTVTPVRRRPIAARLE